MSAWFFSKRRSSPTAYARRRAENAKQEKFRARLDRFAELLSEGRGLPEIAGIMGIGRSTSEEYLRRIRVELGPQAK
jgi:DNA-binding CsgD family transcriptional regulator